MHLRDDKILFIHKEPKSTIEDLFSVEDFIKYVLPLDEEVLETKNSKRVKGLDKVLLAKTFCTKFHGLEAKNIKLTNETVDNFINIFNKLRDRDTENSQTV